MPKRTYEITRSPPHKSSDEVLTLWQCAGTSLSEAVSYWHLNSSHPLLTATSPILSIHHPGIPVYFRFTLYARLVRALEGLP